MGAEAGKRRFEALIASAKDGRVYLPLPFDPDQVWGVKPRHHLRGSIGGCAYRGAIEDFDGARGLSLGPAWRRDNGLARALWWR